MALSGLRPNRVRRTNVTAGYRQPGRMEGGRRLRALHAFGTAAHPLVSVVTVVHNRVTSMEQTIEAVLDQTYPNVEYIVIDGGSTDGTVNILRRHEDRIDYWLSEPDSGIYDAMNKGLDLVLDRNAYVLFANSDDHLYSREAISQLVAGGSGADLVYGKMLVTDGEASVVKGREVTLKDLARETLNHPASIVRRKVFDIVGKFDTSFRIAGDYDLLVRCFAQPVSTRFVPEIISQMSMGGVSEERYMLSCRERKQVVRARFDGFTRLMGICQVNLYDIPRNAARHWLSRAGLLGFWRALKRL